MTRTHRLAAAIVAAIWTAAAVVVCLGLVAWVRG